jgi:uncharacterized repeat protein (TIGR03803 family)
MQIFRHTRRLAVLIPLALASLAAPALAAERTQQANINPVVLLSAPGTDYDDAPSQVRSDMLLGADGNIYMGSLAGGNGPGAIARLTPAGVLSTLYSLKDDGSEGNTIVGKLFRTADGSLYGTTFFGTDEGGGSLFRLATDGTFTTLHKFGGGEPNPLTPYTGVVQGPDGLLYGTTLRGGEPDKGTIYRIGTDGTGFTVLHEFDGADGENPEGELIIGGDGTIYGTTLIGGSSNRGTIFRVTTSGAFESLYSFPAFASVRDGLGLNTVGSNPRAGLLYSATDQTYYGTAYHGGEHGHGTLYSWVPGEDAELVRAFGGPSFSASKPISGVTRDAAGNLYGTSEVGGYLNRGAVWRVAPDGSFSLLHGFTGGPSDGYSPMAGVLAANGTLYGVSSNDTIGGDGAIFTIDTGTAGVLPVQLTASASDLTDTGALGEAVTLEWSAPAGSTCTKNNTVAGIGWSGDAGISGTQQVELTPGIYILGLTCTDADDGNTATPLVVRTAFVGVVVNAPPLQPVDGGGGTGSLNLFLLLLAAAMLFRKVQKES